MYAPEPLILEDAGPPRVRVEVFLYGTPEVVVGIELSDELVAYHGLERLENDRWYPVETWFETVAYPHEDKEPSAGQRREASFTRHMACVRELLWDAASRESTLALFRVWDVRATQGRRPDASSRTTKRTRQFRYRERLRRLERGSEISG